MARLVRAVEGDAAVDGAVLVDADGRRQVLTAVYRTEALRAARPDDREREHGLPVRRLVGLMRLVEVPAVGEEARDVDTWEDLRDLRGVRDERHALKVLRDRGRRTNLERVNLHDWIDELCDALDIDAEVDEALVLDLARDCAHSVERPAAPISTFLLGYAAALHGGSPEKVEELAARATALAESWDGKKDVSADDFEDVDDLVDAD